MTKQSTRSGSPPPPPMELDLIALLDSHVSTDDDDDDDNNKLNSIPHRTIDEILNDSDSSTSSSPPQSPPSILRRLSADPDRPSSASRLSSESSIEETHKSTDAPKPTQLEERLVGSRTGSFGRFNKSGESSEDVFRRGSRPLPSLFGGVRSNAKPGAALAAAAAASRSMPTPHAAAIKSRRSVGIGGFQKVLESEELGSTAGAESETASDELGSNSNGDLNLISLDVSSSGTKLVEGSNSNDEKMEEISRRDGISESSSEGGEVLHCKETESKGEGGTKIDESRVDSAREGLLEANVETQVGSSKVNTGNDLDFVENSAVSFADHVENRIVGTNSGNENERGVGESSTFVDVSDNNETGSSSSLLDADNNEEIAEELETAELEPRDSLKDISKDNDEDLAGDDASQTSEINELVEERIGQLEGRRIRQRAEKKSRPRLKPLELAEELEKKYASTGLHWEEGAAAQPMRLEGVRRGSTTLGYFDVDANNTITRTISSQAFRRDYGSPQVLAVHSNYIAVGMARGVIVVVPSKYSAHNADEMDAKVSFAYLSYMFQSSNLFDAFAFSFLAFVES